MPKSIVWYRKSAEQGNAFAQFNLGHAYHYGNGVETNYLLAQKWYLKSAEQNNMYSEYQLSLLYFLNKVDIPFKNKETLKWITKSAKQGYAKAQSLLCSFYREGEITATNYPEALNWGLKSAEQDYTDAQAIVGEMYRLGEGTKTDLKKSYYWYEKAAKKGDVTAQFWVAKLLFHNKEYSDSFIEYTKCYEMDKNTCGKELAGMYYYGYGTTKDKRKARYILRDLGYKKCSSCSGEGNHECSYCEGSGRRYSWSGSDIGRCNHCRKGYNNCGTCDGVGLFEYN